jgi:hypothetical protein
MEVFVAFREVNFLDFFSSEGQFFLLKYVRKGGDLLMNIIFIVM